MSLSVLAVFVVALAAASFWLGRRRSLAAVGGRASALQSLPGYYGWYAALWSGLPGLVVLLIWMLFFGGALERLTLDSLPEGAAGGSPAEIELLLHDARNAALGQASMRANDPEVIALAERWTSLQETGLLLAFGLALVLGLIGSAYSLRAIAPGFAARAKVERAVGIGLMLCSTLAVLVTVGIVLSLAFETWRFFERVSIREFLFGLHWSPQTALRADQVGSSGSFGAVPIFVGTLLVTLIAMLVAVPIGLFSAIYMTFYSDRRLRAVVKPALEILAGVPTVVYGFFAALVVAPIVRDAGVTLGLDVASESALAAGLVMGVMIIPFVSSLSDDAISAVPQSLRDGSFGLGATRSETIRQVILPAALPGIAGAFLLAVSRAVGETMIVVMAAGLAANLTANPLAAVTTVTVQIVTLLTGDQEFDSAKTLSAFALGLVLFCVTLLLNVIALRVVQRFREKYD
jgi:phosphate transport system permease protein